MRQDRPYDWRSGLARILQESGKDITQRRQAAKIRLRGLAQILRCRERADAVEREEHSPLPAQLQLSPGLSSLFPSGLQ